MGNPLFRPIWFFKWEFFPLNPLILHLAAVDRRISADVPNSFKPISLLGLIALHCTILAIGYGRGTADRTVLPPSLSSKLFLLAALTDFPFIVNKRDKLSFCAARTLLACGGVLCIGFCLALLEIVTFPVFVVPGLVDQVIRTAFIELLAQMTITDSISEYRECNRMRLFRSNCHHIGILLTFVAVKLLLVWRVRQLFGATFFAAPPAYFALSLVVVGFSFPELAWVGEE